MPPVIEAGRGGAGVAFLVSAGIVYEIVAANCSSPQTVEINAKGRAATLMKWVHIGQAQSAAFLIVAAAVDERRRAPILAGGILAMAIMEIAYLYGKRSGLASSSPGTESY